MMLNREQILAAPDLRRETVAVPEWGGDVVVSELSAAALAEFLGMAFDDAGKAKLAPVLFNAHLAAAAIVGEDGKPLFAGGELVGKNPQVVARVAEVANRLNFLHAGAVEEVAGN